MHQCKLDFHIHLCICIAFTHVCHQSPFCPGYCGMPYSNRSSSCSQHRQRCGRYEVFGQGLWSLFYTHLIRLQSFRPLLQTEKT